ncbi:MAG: Cysteine--tRNA ligase [Acetothermia bacterium 64_32]|nr:MAG: Cysteine--tRNA ligase [Acetothermia bacterium 64_32]HAF69941.1 cysteine--tRNA ligase [Candidatus Acetothermia bacterium]
MQLYSTLSRRLEELLTDTVRMYVCGPTVYDLIHIGNARPFIVFDALRRYLESQGKKVIHVQNITDVDDKIINRAREEGVPPSQVAARYTEEYFRDLEGLGVNPPTHSPKATEYVPKMVEFIEKLVEKGHAYVVEGDVYFSVATFPEYGKLSGKVLEELEAGARIAVDEKKRDPLDFALWKAGRPGEPKWPSPWGEGRPGWHTECVVMAMDILGVPLDIHAGGNDLIFPHHENEIAQAEAATGEEFARIWLHNGMLTVRGEKMAKSLGNFSYARDVVAEYGTEAVRYFYLSRAYRKPLDFSEAALREAKRAVEGVYGFLWEAEALPEEGEIPEAFSLELSSLEEKFHARLSDDFDTAGAIGALQEIVGAAHRLRQAGGGPTGLRAAAALLRRLAQPLGLFQTAPPQAKGLAEELIQLLVELRAALRRERNFALADHIRTRLAELGVELRDGPEGTIWLLRGRNQKAG